MMHQTGIRYIAAWLASTSIVAVFVVADEPPRPLSPPTVSELLVIRTNASRAEQKLPPLAADPRLTAAAQALADHMARTGQLSHSADGRTPAQRVEAQTYRWTFVAENIAFRSAAGTTADETARLLLEQWLNSPGHRSNLLSTQPQHLGCAAATAADGSVYAVQVFARPAAADSAAAR